jgi:hypothetical protein
VEHASSGIVPTHHFQHVVVYASEPEAQAGLEPFLASCTFPQHVLQVPVYDLSAAPGPTAAPASILQKQQQLQQQAARLEVAAQANAGRLASPVQLADWARPGAWLD